MIKCLLVLTLLLGCATMKPPEPETSIYYGRFSKGYENVGRYGASGNVLVDMYVHCDRSSLGYYTITNFVFHFTKGHLSTEDEEEIESSTIEELLTAENADDLCTK